MEAFVVWMNLFGAASAGWANLWATYVWRESRAAIFYGAMATFAWFYAGGYVYLLVTEDFHGWSEFFRTISITVWPLAWALPTVAATRTRVQDLQRIKETTHQVSDALDVRVSEGLHID